MESKNLKIAATSEIPEGEMKSFKVEDKEILIVRRNGEFFALGAHCPHYGAPLEKGLLHGDRIVCPWHHSCFHAKTGRLEEPPSLDDLPSYEISVAEGDIYVRLPLEVSMGQKPKMSRRKPSDKRVFAILGGGAAGAAAAQTLREDGFEGEIVMITKESDLPYDRPNLSKDYLRGEAPEEWMPLRPQSFYEENGIEAVHDQLITDLDAQEKVVTLGEGQRIHFDKALIATGGIPKTLKAPGADLGNVFTLRSYQDARNIISQARDVKKIVVVGSSFIGMETAFSLSKEAEATVVSRDSVPFENTLGKEIGEIFRRQHEKGGVNFRLGKFVQEIKGDGAVEEVVLNDGERLEAQLVLAGIGVQPSTDFIKGIEVKSDGGVLTNEFMECAPDIYAAGDIAIFPCRFADGPIRIEHWRTAQQQGRVAAHNMAGYPTPYDSVPFFWTRQAGISLQFIGHATQWEEIIYDGDPASMSFLAYYIKGDRIQAVAGCARPKDMMILHELMRDDRLPQVSQIRNEQINYSDLLHAESR